MAPWRTRQTYPAVVGTMVLLVGLFTGVALLRPLIPPPDPNPVVGSRGDFMAGAARQRIKWRTLKDQPFLEARRADKPVLIVAGAAWNWTAREFDRTTLGETEVAERMNREFVPVRIDLGTNPEWAPGPFPLSSAVNGMDPGFYILVTRPNGEPLVYVERGSFQYRIDSPVFLSVLSRARSLFVQDPKLSQGALLKLAEANREAMGLGGQSPPADLSQYLRALVERAKSTAGLVEPNAATLLPNEFRFLNAAGEAPAARAGLRTLCQSPLTDWFDGGYFRTAAGLPIEVKLEKTAVSNAELAAALASVARSTGDQTLAALARSTASSVLTTMLGRRPPTTFLYFESGTNGRSDVYSFRPSQLKATFSGPDQAQLATVLGLDPTTNPQMTVRVTNIDDSVGENSTAQKLLRSLDRLRQRRPPAFGGSGDTEALCLSYARLMETVRLLGRTDFGSDLAKLWGLIETLRVGEDSVVRALSSEGVAVPYVGDYLAYVDSAFETYLLTRDKRSLDSGLAVLARCGALFGSDGTALLSPVPTERRLKELAWLSWPEVTDSMGESDMARYIRLCQVYSCAYRDQPLGKRLRETALRAVSELAGLSTQTPLRIGGLMRSFLLASQETYVVTIGPGALAAARRLWEASPELTVVPAAKGVRADLGQAEGVWVFQQGRGTRFDTTDMALERLRARPSLNN